MKKRIIAMLLAMSMVVIATGCGKKYTITESGAVYNDYVQVNKWKGLEVERVEPMAVTEEELEANIKTDLQTIAKVVEITERGAQNGDRVTINFEGKLDGVAFEGGTGSDTFILGEGRFVEGFQEGIVGHKAGDTFDVPLTFPKDYTEELAGKAVVFTMTLNKVEEQIIPELTDEVAKQLKPEAKTVEEYKELMRAELEKNNKESAEETMRSNLLTTFFEQCEAIDCPEDELEELLPKVEEYMKEYLEYAVYSQFGVELEEYMKATGYSEEQLLGTTYEEVAQLNLLQKYSLQLVLDVEEVSYTEDEYEKFLKEEADRQFIENVDELVEFLESYKGPGGAKLYFLQTKVADILWKNCKIVEPKETETGTVTE